MNRFEPSNPAPINVEFRGRSSVAAIAFVLFLMHGSVAAADEPELTRFDFSQVHMGAPVRIILYAPDQAAAERASAAAFARFAELDRVMSDYNPESELSKLCLTAGQGKPVPVSEDLWRVLSRAQEFSRATDGAFDVTVGPSVRLWRRARRRKELPPAERLTEAKSAVGWKHIELDPKNGAVKLLAPKMQLDLGGIGMGFATDEAMRVLEKHGVRRAIIDASGDMLAADPPPGKKGWKVGVLPLEPKKGAPSRYLLLKRNAVTTSGDAFQFVEIDGTRYSHIVDPRTGSPLTDQSTVCVVANDCTTADAAATAVSVLGPKRGIRYVESIRGAEAAIVRSDRNGNISVTSSRGFDAISSRAPPKGKMED